MTISPFMVYLVFQADRIIEFAFGLAAISVFLCVLALVSSVFFDSEDKGKGREIAFRVVKYSAISFLCFSAVATAIPKTSTMVAMMVIPPVVNNEQVQQLPAEVLTWIRDQLKTKEM